MSRARSEELFARARGVIPGGVNSPVRAYRGVGGSPVFLARGQGARVWDVDGNEYVDYVGSWGPLILGHAHPEIVEAVEKAARDGTSFGAPTEREVVFAEKIRVAFPSLQKLRLVSSGTEATMAAIRVARGFTGRDKIVKIDGGYHGHADSFLVAAGSGAATLGIPGSAGVTQGTAADTLTVAFNDEAALRAIFDEHGAQIAAFIVEPVCGNFGCAAPVDGYLQAARAITKQHGALLIFDEVITGFRIAYGGAQERFGVTPDLTCLGKIIGGGLPAAAYGGSAEVMGVVAPDGPVYQAGTLSGNPLAVAAGTRMIELLARDGTYAQLEAAAARLVDGLGSLAREAGVDVTSNRVGSMWTGFFVNAPVNNYADAKLSDSARFGRFFHAMLDRGVLLAPSQFECGFVSLAHGDAEIDRTLEVARDALKAI